MHQFDFAFDLIKLILIGLFCSGVLLILILNLKSRKLTYGNKITTTVLISICLLEISSLYISKFVSTRIPDLTLFFCLLIGPSLFLFIKNSLQPNIQFIKAFFWHTAPALFWLYLMIVDLHPYSWAVSLFVCVHFGIYLLMSLYWLYSKKDTGSNKNKIASLWNLLIALSFLYVSIFAEAFFSEPKLGVRYSILIIFLAFLYLVFRYAVLKAFSIYTFYKYEKNKTDIDLSKKYQNSPLTHQSSRRLAEELTTLMETNKLYLEEGLNLAEISKKLGTSPKYLSQAINENLGCNFFDLINNYRIEEAKRMITDKKYFNHKIYEIMYAVGFNSRSSFISAFKKNTGLTPTEYRNKYLKK